MPSLTTPITIRLAAPGDELALARLAALDSADSVPTGRLLLAEVGGYLRVALSLCDGSTIADPFYPTSHIINLLRAHAQGPAEPRTWRRRLRFNYALS